MSDPIRMFESRDLDSCGGYDPALGPLSMR